MNRFFFNLKLILPDRIKEKLGFQKTSIKKKISNQIKSENGELLSKFEATLLGSLIGDCFGRKCEGIWGFSLYEIIEEFHQLKQDIYNIYLVNNEIESYSDDTALNKAICSSLIKKGEFDLVDIANSFQKEFFNQPNRNFDESSVSLFKKLNSLSKCNQLTNKCLLPAMELYNDICLSDNSAIRCSPIALFTYNKSLEEMKLICELSTKITHSQDWAVIGAMQQCYAIREALNHSKLSIDSFDLDVFYMKIVDFVVDLEENYKLSDKINYENLENLPVSLKKNFLLYLNQKTQMLNCRNNSSNYKNLELIDNYLIKDYINEYLKEIETTKSNDSYSKLLKKLHKIIKRCRRGAKINIESLYKQVGKYNCLSSIQSIPIALFTFMIAVDPRCKHELNIKLMDSKEIDSFKEYNSIERVILYAISYGGDTDTVCSMAGAIAGAYSLENEDFPYYLVEKCESFGEIRLNAQSLYELSKTSNTSYEDSNEKFNE